MRILIAGLIAAYLSGTGTNAALAQQAPSATSPSALPVLVYKTKKDYSRQVAVTLSDDKSKIVSYPDPADCAAGWERLQPEQLHKGFLLDKRGLTRNVAFLKIT
jgi:hypothetical protein